MMVKLKAGTLSKEEDVYKRQLLRQKANYGVLEGFLTLFLGEKGTILEIMESESNQLSAEDKCNRVDICLLYTSRCV